MAQERTVMSKQDFLANDLFTREYYEGLLITMGSDGNYQIGIQLDENKVVKVDSASPDQVRERVENWAMQVQDVKAEYRVRDDQTAEIYGQLR